MNRSWLNWFRQMRKPWIARGSTVWRGQNRCRLAVEELERRQLMSTAAAFDPAGAIALTAGVSQTGVISAAPAYYAVTVTESGRLTAELSPILGAVSPQSGTTRLTLMSPDRQVLVQSDGLSQTNPNDLIDIHVTGSSGGTTYYLEVQGLGGTAGTYALQTGFTTATPPFQALPVENFSWGHAFDLRGNGITDLVTTSVTAGDVSVLLGRGDGTFAPQAKYDVGFAPNDVIAADVTGNGVQDLITTNYSGSVSILLGNGDGTFAAPIQIVVGVSPSSVVAGDFNGDGHVDLAVSDPTAGDVAVLLGNGDGTFAAPSDYAVGAGPYRIIAADFRHDGRLDLATANVGDNSVSVLLGNGDGTFQPQRAFAVGKAPDALVAGDFNGDGRLDIATANTGSNDVSILLGNGDVTFGPATSLAAGSGTTGIVAADFTGDGHLDLAATNLTAGTLSVFVGRGDGTFAAQITLNVGSTPAFIVAADFNRDGNMDLAHGDLSGHVFIDLRRGDGTFQTLPPTSRVAGDSDVKIADFNGDGRSDLVVLNNDTNDVQILLGRGDGTFQIGGRYATGATDPSAVAVGDFNGDGIPDLAVTNLAGGVSILLGRGDGTFGPATVFTAGNAPSDVAVGDFNGDGKLDLAVADLGDNAVSILLGHGDGTFAVPVKYTVANGPFVLAAVDLNGDGILDLATANEEANDVSVLYGRGDGTFGTAIQLPTGAVPTGIAVGDFNGDGIPDLATTNIDNVSVLLGIPDSHGNPSGTFAPAVNYTAGDSPTGLAVGDFYHDGRLDLATANGDGSMTVLVGNGDGTFQAEQVGQVGDNPQVVRAGDLTGNGTLDLVTANVNSNDVSVLLGNGDGTFRSQIRSPVPDGPLAILPVDLTGNGTTDLVTANFDAGTVSVRLGQGDGTFQDPLTFAVGNGPDALSAGDFNGDGRSDLAVANFLDGTVSILLGIGDGTFEPPLTLAVGSQPDALATGDFNGDGLLDLAVANYGSGTMSVFLGRSDGTFKAAQQISVGAGPIALAVGDANNDGTSELIVANSLSRNLSILEGDSAGMFRVVATVALGSVPNSVVMGDFNGDGKLDLATTDQTDNAVSVLLANGDGTFQAPVRFATGTGPISLVIGDFKGDGHLDLATANYNSNDVTVLLGRGDGTFQAQARYTVGAYPSSLVVCDFNNDGRLDLATANGLGEAVSVGLGFGDGSFTTPGMSFEPVQARPIVADFNGDGIPDVVVLRGDGKILFRAGLAAGGFRAPVVVNPDLAWAARDLTIGSTPLLTYLVATDARAGSLAYYAYLGGQFRQVFAVNVPGALPAHFLYGDINGDGLQDGIMYLGDTGQIIVYLQHPNDDLSIRPPDYLIQVGRGVSCMTLADINGDGRLDILVTDEATGEVHVFLNSATAAFSSELTFRAGDGLANLAQVNGTPQVESLDQPVAMVVGLFSGGTILDLAVLNQGANRVDILVGDGQGGVFNPSPALSLPTGPDPVAILTADFNGDGIPDLAVLNKGSSDLSIFLGNGHGGFTEQAGTGPDGQKVRPGAGNSPTGATAADLNGDGKLDLLVGNAQGDILILLGNGDGTFRPYQRIDRHVGLAVTDLSDADGPGIAFANESLDQVAYQADLSTTTFQQGRQNGLLAPSAVQFADLNGDGIADLIVVNSGSNNILVYLGLGNDEFGPAHRFFVGTDPTGITVGDLNGDGFRDLVVANEGSNDVSIWFGQGQGADWGMTRGPRLNAGVGPVATVVQDVNGDGIPDILVANSQSNNVYLLLGVGHGFFNDKNPVIYQTGANPVQLFVGNFDTRPGLDLVTINAGSNDLTFFSSFGAGRSIATGGLSPTAAVMGDFVHDGLTGLVVVNSGSNQVSLMLAGIDGPQIAATLSIAGPSNLSDIALGAEGSTSAEVYVTREGSEAVTLLTFALNLSPDSRQSSELPNQSSSAQQITEFSPMPDAPLELIATLVFVSIEQPLPLQADSNARNEIAFTSGNDEGWSFTESQTAMTTDLSVDLGAFITGASEMPAGQSLVRRNADGISVPNSSLPPLEPFDFSDTPATGVERREIGPERDPKMPPADGSDPEGEGNLDRTADSTRFDLIQAVAAIVPESVPVIMRDGSLRHDNLTGDRATQTTRALKTAGVRVSSASETWIVAALVAPLLFLPGNGSLRNDERSLKRKTS